MTKSAEETQELAADFARSLEAGAVVGLMGPLGAGKTTFIQGMAQGLSIDPEAYVTSPTFALIHEYDDKLYHFDLYRLKHFDEVLDVGLEDYVQRGGICVIEWADRFVELANILTHRVSISSASNDTRSITIDLA